MTELRDPHHNFEGKDGVVPPMDGSHDQDALERYEQLKNFLDMVMSPKLKLSEDAADFIVAALKAKPEEDWTRQLQLFKVDTLDFTDESFRALCDQDEILSRIYETVQATAKSGRGQGLTSERKALLELMDLRAGVSIQFDRAVLTNEENEKKWNDVLNRIAP